MGSGVKQIRVMLLIVLGLAACATAIYISYVNDRKAYFADRNLRHLEMVGGQVASKIASYQGIIRNYVAGQKAEVKLKDAGKSDAESTNQPAQPKKPAPF